MNRTHLIILWIGIILIVLMGLFPPWTLILEGSVGTLGYAFILSRPRKICNINTSLLFAQWIMVAVVTGGLIITFKDKKPKDEQKQ